jgi:hypothetical protein
VVSVSQPLQRNVTDFKDFTGRTDPVNSVNIVPRVTGYLVKEPFKEGSEVKKDDLLFETDPRPYKAQLDQAPTRSPPGCARDASSRFTGRWWQYSAVRRSKAWPPRADSK